MAGKFEISKAKDGDYHFHLRAANGQIPCLVDTGSAPVEAFVCSRLRTGQ
jgi:hypothetical protein